MIDFDLLKVKQQVGNKPAPPEVSQRQAIIDRRLRKKATAMTPSPINNTPKRIVPPTQEKPVEPPKPKPVAPAQTVAASELTEDENLPVSEQLEPAPKRRQKTKPKTTSGDENADTTD